MKLQIFLCNKTAVIIFCLVKTYVLKICDCDKVAYFLVFRLKKNTYMQVMQFVSEKAEKLGKLILVHLQEYSFSTMLSKAIFRLVRTMWYRDK